VCVGPLQLHLWPRPPRLHNRQTEEVYMLPPGGTVKPYDGSVCPLDNYELCLFVSLRAAPARRGHASRPMPGRIR
jgi:hypothetical protein